MGRRQASKGRRFSGRQKSCGKRRFRDHAEAVRALRLAKERSSRQKIPVRAYECSVCGGWHVTSQP